MYAMEAYDKAKVGQKIFHSVSEGYFIKAKSVQDFWKFLATGFRISDAVGNFWEIEKDKKIREFAFFNQLYGALGLSINEKSITKIIVEYTEE